MNNAWSLRFITFLLCVMGYTQLYPTATAAQLPKNTTGIYPYQGFAYLDEFGYAESNYSMGDFVRYTVSGGLGITNGIVPINPIDQKYAKKPCGYNIYFNMTEIPYAADIAQYVYNAENLYNTLGYLFAGFAALNINPSQFVTGAAGTKFINSPWLNQLRIAGQKSTGSLGFDNNNNNQTPVQLINYPDNPNAYRILADRGMSYDAMLSMYPTVASAIDHGRFFLNADFHGGGTDCSNACTWFNAGAACILAVPAWGNGYAAPYAQFFGGRLSHILGAVTNDVAASNTASITTTWPAMPTGTPRPQVAQFVGQATPPVGSTTPSTAHFGSFLNFINYWSSNETSRAIISSPAYAYLTKHLQPTLQRFATGGVAVNGAATPLCSYALALNTLQANLIKIKDANITSYDNGLIVGIANNTGGQLVVKQCMAGGTNAQIGTLDVGHNDFYVHTASLMPTMSNQQLVTTNNEPTLGNMIEIKDMQADESVFLQLLSADQLATLVQSPGGCSNASGCGDMANYFGLFSSGASAFSLAYNQTGTYQLPTVDSQLPATYLVISNFNLQNLATYIAAKQNNSGAEIPNIADMRVQAINITTLQGMPYVATLQINKVLKTYGLNDGVINQGAVGLYSLQPSIVSVKSFAWLNPYAQQLGSTFYSYIPLLMLPEYVTNAYIPGLEAHYGIWLMSYAAALTEFKFGGCRFGDTIDCLQKTFNLFGTTAEGQVPARVVMDTNGVLASGQQMVLIDPIDTAQHTGECYALMGSDVFDIGNQFHQDIPIVSLYADEKGNPVANKTGGEIMNLNLVFHNHEQPDQAPEVRTVKKLYGLPYHTMMFFSVPTLALTRGVEVFIKQVSDVTYQITIQDPTNIENNSAVNTVYTQQTITLLDDEISNLIASIRFLNGYDRNWDIRAFIHELPKAVGQEVRFVLKYMLNGVNHLLDIDTQYFFKEKMIAKRLANAKKKKKVEKNNVVKRVKKKAVLKTDSEKTITLPAVNNVAS